MDSHGALNEMCPDRLICVYSGGNRTYRTTGYASDSPSLSVILKILTHLVAGNNVEITRTERADRLFGIRTDRPIGERKFEHGRNEWRYE